MKPETICIEIAGSAIDAYKQAISFCNDWHQMKITVLKIDQVPDSLTNNVRFHLSLTVMEAYILGEQFARKCKHVI